MKPDEGLPYRTGDRSQLPAAMPTFSPDEAEYSTLKAVRLSLGDAVRSLEKDYNLLDINAEQMVSDMVYAQTVAREIGIKQGVYQIVAPLLEAVSSAIDGVDQKNKERTS